MEIYPTPNNGIQPHNQVLLWGGFILAYDAPDFRKEGFDSRLGGSNQQFAIIFPHVAAKKIESLVDVRDDRLFLW